MRSLLFYFFRRNPHNIDDIIWCVSHKPAAPAVHNLVLNPVIIETAAADCFITRFEAECSYRSENGKKHSFEMLYGAYINNPAEARRKQALKKANRLFADDLTKLDCAEIDYYSHRKNFTL